jgi:hypothetical protein
MAAHYPPLVCQEIVTRVPDNGKQQASEDRCQKPNDGAEPGRRRRRAAAAVRPPTAVHRAWPGSDTGRFPGPACRERLVDCSQACCSTASLPEDVPDGVGRKVPPPDQPSGTVACKDTGLNYCWFDLSRFVPRVHYVN